MKCLSKSCGVFLVIVNIFFLLIGLAFFGLGLFARFGSDIINGYVDSIKESIETSLKDSGLGTIDMSSFDISELLFGVALGLIFFGLFLIIVTILGCLGGCCKIKFVLIAYVVACIVLLAGQIVVMGILYSSPDTFHDPTKKTMKDNIQSSYAGLNGTTVVSMGWNIVMQKVKCCGVDNYADFTGAENWVINYTGYTLKTPLACCKTLPDSFNFTCASYPDDNNNYWKTGCYDRIWNLSLGNTAIVAGSLAGAGVFHLILIVAGIVLVCSDKKKMGYKDVKQLESNSPQTPSWGAYLWCGTSWFLVTNDPD